MDYTIRKLTRKDRRTLTRLLLKFVEKTKKNELINMIPSNDNKESEKYEAEKTLNFSMDILEEMVTVIDDDIAKWFADLIGVTVEKFDELEFDIETEIINQLVASDGFKNFFSKGLQVRRKISEFASQLAS